MFAHTGRLPNHLRRVFIVFKSGNEGHRIEGVVTKGHVMRVCQHQVTSEELSALSQHEGTQITTGSLYPNLVPPPGESCGPTSKLE